jgi:DNA-binding response OmpR family regulator
MLVRAAGHDVRTVFDGSTALQAVLEYRPDAVLLDIGLPDLSGYEVAKQVREHSNLGDVMLIALTGYGQWSDKQTSHEAGFNHHLVKPAEFKEVEAILATITRNS